MDSGDEWIAAQDARVQPVLMAARRLVRRRVPHANEHVYAGWNALGYKVGRLFCVVYPHGGGVKLAFERGQDLLDPKDLLRQTGKRMKFVWVDRVGGLTTEVGNLIAQASALAGDE